MINARELRIGNYVAKPPLIICFPIDSINEDGVRIECEYGSATAQIKSDALQPISLTEEWLVKFDFDKVTELVEGDVCVGFGRLIDEFTYLTINEHNASLTDKEDMSIVLLPMPIEYIHQLQNLYFALTGEELKIKE